MPLQHEGLVRGVRVDAGLRRLRRAGVEVARGRPAGDPRRDALVGLAGVVGIGDRPGVVKPRFQPASRGGEGVRRVARAGDPALARGRDAAVVDDRGQRLRAREVEVHDGLAGRHHGKIDADRREEARCPGTGRDDDGPCHDLLAVDAHVHRAAAELQRENGRPLAHVDPPVDRGREQGGVRSVRVQEAAVALVDGGLPGIQAERPARRDLLRRERLVGDAAGGERAGGRRRGRAEVEHPDSLEEPVAALVLERAPRVPRRLREAHEALVAVVEPMDA